MWLVIFSTADRPALWAFGGLKKLAPGPVELVCVDTMAYSQDIRHWVGPGDKSGFSFSLHDGRQINSEDVTATLNRVCIVPTAHLNSSSVKEKQYAIEEFNALFISLLSSLDGAVVNRPTTTGLCGAFRHPSQWTYLAAQAGLYTRAFVNGDSAQGRRAVSGEYGSPITPPVTVIVAGQAVFGPDIPDQIKKRCVRLASLTGATLLGIDFNIDKNRRWFFAGANPAPDLRLGGEGLLEHLADMFTSKEKEFAG